MIAKVNRSKQTTFDSLPIPRKKLSQMAACGSKKIIISKVDVETRENELALKTIFRLMPSKAAYSKITFELYFDSHIMNTILIAIPQGPLAKDDFELTSVLDVKGVSAGPHIIKVEMFELWSSGEKLTTANKEVSVEYVPIKREDRFVKVPIVKYVAGADLIIVSDSDKGIYHQMEEDIQKEQTGRRDKW